MGEFDYLLNWKLKAGSHPFPGPNGGTCLNEAALVAAGFPYQQIWSAEDMPECFSRPICALVLLLNDLADDEERQSLLPYVTRLACADSPAVERERSNLIFLFVHCCYVTGAPFGVATLPFHKGLEILDIVLAIGRQADLFCSKEVTFRMKTASRQMANDGLGEPVQQI